MIDSGTRGTLVRNLAAALLFGLFVFAVGMARERWIEESELTEAIATGAVAGGSVFLLLATRVYVLWRRERRAEGGG